MSQVSIDARSDDGLKIRYGSAPKRPEPMHLQQPQCPFQTAGIVQLLLFPFGEQLSLSGRGRWMELPKEELAAQMAAFPCCRVTNLGSSRRKSDDTYP